MQNGWAGLRARQPRGLVRDTWKQDWLLDSTTTRSPGRNRSSIDLALGDSENAAVDNGYHADLLQITDRANTTGESYLLRIGESSTTHSSCAAADRAVHRYMAANDSAPWMERGHLAPRTPGSRTPLMRGAESPRSDRALRRGIAASYLVLDPAATDVAVRREYPKARDFPASSRRVAALTDTEARGTFV